MASMFSLEGKNAAIVGAGSGLGAAVAIACAEKGAYVCCLDIDLDAAGETATTIRDAGGVKPVRDASTLWTALP